MDERERRELRGDLFDRGTFYNHAGTASIAPQPYLLDQAVCVESAHRFKLRFPQVGRGRGVRLVGVACEQSMNCIVITPG